MVLQLFFSRVVGLPFWWYGRGLKLIIEHLTRAVSNFAEALAVRIWAKNLFIPMYGDTSVLGRAVSFGIRLIMLVVRSLAVVIYTIGMIIILLVYLLILPISVVGFIYNFFGFFV